MEAAKAVRATVVQNAAGKWFDRITVVIGDLHLHCDVTSRRDMLLAQRLAASHGVPFDCVDDIWKRNGDGAEYRVARFDPAA